MIEFFKKYSGPISVLVLIVVLWKHPVAIEVISGFLLLVGLVIASVSVFKKHRDTYHQGKITRGVLVRNVSVEIFGILIAMTLAGLLGRTIAQISTEQINDDSIKLIAGIVIGLLAGMGVGVLVKRMWGRLVQS